jgi:hypothetical protein
VNCRIRVPRQERRISRRRWPLLSPPPAASVPVEGRQITTSRLVSIISPVRLHLSNKKEDGGRQQQQQQRPNGVMGLSVVVVLDRRPPLAPQRLPAASSTCFSLRAAAARRPLTVVSTQVKKPLPDPADGHPGAPLARRLHQRRPLQIYSPL